jgi:hypothetical protein
MTAVRRFGLTRHPLISVLWIPAFAGMTKDIAGMTKDIAE